MVRTLPEQTKPSIDEFVHRRWVDAKSKLRELDPDFVAKLETVNRLEKINLTPHQPYDLARRPKRHLSSEWHRLLEACFEMTLQASILHTSAVHLTPDANRVLAVNVIGQQANYHIPSWFGHAITLAERGEEVIRCTSTVYVAELGARKKLIANFENHVRDKISDALKTDETTTYMVR